MSGQFLIVLALAFFSGFVSLSYEIIWARLFSWSTAGAASAFPMLLGLFLAGIAVGARWSKRFTHGEATYSSKALRALAGFIAASAFAGWLVIPAMARLTAINAPIPGYTALYFVFCAACLFGAQLPLLMHYGIEPNDRAGARLSYVYILNILGSVAGSLLTGFYWLDLAPTETVVKYLTMLGLLLATVLYASTKASARSNIAVVGAYVVSTGLVLGLTAPVYDGMLERMFYGMKYEGQKFQFVIENKSGFIAVDDDDVAYGGGVYDGEFSVDLVDDVNGIIRPFSVSAFQPDPKNVLVIGMATGSWARVLAEHPDVENVVVVEINPGYYDLVSRYPTSAKLLDHPKVTLVDDDGRRWLHTTDRKFDAIVSNTSFNQRGFASTLLSTEFMELAKDHLTDDGIIMVNTTGSKRAMRSMVDVFGEGHVVAYMRSGIASPSPIKVDTKRFIDVLTRYEIDGKRVIDPTISAHKERLDGIVGELVEERDNYLNPTRIKEITTDEEPITDANMGHEWQFDLLGM